MRARRKIAAYRAAGDRAVGEARAEIEARLSKVVEQYGPLKFVTVKWRLTPKGKQALARLRELDGEDFL